MTVDSVVAAATPCWQRRKAAGGLNPASRESLRSQVPANNTRGDQAENADDHDADEHVVDLQKLPGVPDQVADAGSWMATNSAATSTTNETASAICRPAKIIGSAPKNTTRVNST